ncbi:MAG: hypothetical protein RMY29_020140 [Nostoc sp. CreGUA01]|nr:hypothetical protein [Nostoc sp. CreGUA01]
MERFNLAASNEGAIANLMARLAKSINLKIYQSKILKINIYLSNI